MLPGNGDQVLRPRPGRGPGASGQFLSRLIPSRGPPPWPSRRSVSASATVKRPVAGRRRSSLPSASETQYRHLGRQHVAGARRGEHAGRARQAGRRTGRRRRPGRRRHRPSQTGCRAGSAHGSAVIGGQQVFRRRQHWHHATHRRQPPLAAASRARQPSSETYGLCATDHTSIVRRRRSSQSSTDTSPAARAAAARSTWRRHLGHHPAAGIGGQLPPPPRTRSLRSTDAAPSRYSLRRHEVASMDPEAALGRPLLGY